MNGVTGRSLRALLFTDIEGSTTLLRQWERALRGCARPPLQRIILAAAGRAGPATSSAGRVTRCSSPFRQRRPRWGVRVGGTAWDRAGALACWRSCEGSHGSACRRDSRDSPAGLVGLAIHQAARISNAAHGGQIVISGDVVEQVAGLPSDSTIRPLGTYVLRDVGQVSPCINSITWICRTSFPALRTKRAVSHSAADAVDHVRRAVRRAGQPRAVVAVAPPRHRHRSGRRRQDPVGAGRGAGITDEQDGVVFVDLVKVTDPEMVVAADRDAADVPETSGRDAARRSSRRSPTRLPPGRSTTASTSRTPPASVVERLLSAARRCASWPPAGVRLMLPFEHVVVRARPVARQRRWPRGTPRRCSSSGWSLPAPTAPSDERGMGAARAICAALDGHCAGRSSWRRPGPRPRARGARRGARRRAWTCSTVGARGGDRHRSLRAAIDWSYELLDADERAVLRRRAMFAAPATSTPSAQSRQPSPRWSSPRWRPGRLEPVALKARITARYRVLETIRQYAVEPAESNGEADILRGAHLEWCRARPRRSARHAPGDERGAPRWTPWSMTPCRAGMGRPGRRRRGGRDRDGRHARRRPVPARSSRRGPAPVRGGGGAGRASPAIAVVGCASPPGRRRRATSAATPSTCSWSAADIALAAGAGGRRGADSRRRRRPALPGARDHRRADRRRGRSTPSSPGPPRSPGAAPAEAAIAVAAGWTIAASVRSVADTERALRLAATPTIRCSSTRRSTSSWRSSSTPAASTRGSDDPRPATRPAIAERADRRRQRLRPLRRPAHGRPHRGRRRHAPRGPGATPTPSPPCLTSASNATSVSADASRSTRWPGTSSPSSRRPRCSSATGGAPASQWPGTSPSVRTARRRCRDDRRGAAIGRDRWIDITRALMPDPHRLARPTTSGRRSSTRCSRSTTATLPVATDRLAADPEDLRCVDGARWITSGCRGTPRCGPRQHAQRAAPTSKDAPRSTPPRSAAATRSPRPIVERAHRLAESRRIRASTTSPSASPPSIAHTSSPELSTWAAGT